MGNGMIGEKERGEGKMGDERDGREREGREEVKRKITSYLHHFQYKLMQSLFSRLNKVWVEIITNEPLPWQLKCVCLHKPFLQLFK